MTNQNVEKSCIKKGGSIQHDTMVMRLSLLTNIIVVAAMIGIAIVTRSLSLIASLTENAVDTVVQSMLWWAGVSSKTVDYAKYPAGKSRFEPISVIIAAALMSICAVLVIQESIVRLQSGFSNGDVTDIQFSIPAIVVVGLAVGTKVCVYIYGVFVNRVYHSPGVEAVTQDNRNDILSNSFAIAAFLIAALDRNLWYIDSIGGIVIFIFVIITWALTAKEQIMLLVGVTASADFIEEVTNLTNKHHELLNMDSVKAYHFGTKYLVEVEVVLPSDMTLAEAHNIGIQLQYKIEQLENVERAFVHIDHKKREYDEHVVSRDLEARFKYADDPLLSPLDGEIPLKIISDQDSLIGARASI